MTNPHGILNLAQKLEGNETGDITTPTAPTAAQVAALAAAAAAGTVALRSDPTAPTTPQEWQRHNDVAIAMVLLNVAPGLAVPMGNMTDASEAWAYLKAEYEWTSYWNSVSAARNAPPLALLSPMR